MSDRKQAVVKWTAYALAYLIVHFFSTCVFARYPLGGSVPEMAPVAVALVAIFEGSLGGSVFGLCVGFFTCMVQYGAGSGMILWCTLIGMFAGLLLRTGLGKNLVGSIFASAAGLLWVELIRFFGALFSDLGSAATLFHIGGMEFLYSMILLFPAYPLFRFVYRNFGAGTPA